MARGERTRARSYPHKFKFQVVLELLQGEQTVGQLAKSYNVHPHSILKVIQRSHQLWGLALLRTTRAPKSSGIRQVSG